MVDWLFSTTELVVGNK